MSDASPQDLAVSFRSIPRRRREARGDAPAGTTSSLDQQIDRQLAVAGGLMRTSADATFIADAIDAVHAKEWDDATLTSLRAIATDIGRMLRDMSALAGDTDR